MRHRERATARQTISATSTAYWLFPLLFAAMLAVGVAGARAGEIETTFKVFEANATAVVDNGAWNRLLGAYVVPAENGLNRVDYARFKREGAKELKAYVAHLEAVDVTKLNRDEQFAFWANLYNAKTIDIILDHYPVASIKDIRLTLWRPFDGPWAKEVVKVNGIDLSLNDIEHKIMRVLWREPRVHYAVNCASIGCPNLATTAYGGAALEAMLDAAARAYINSPRGVRVEGGKVVASKIYSWFADDFGGTVKGVLAHVRAHAGPGLAKRLSGVTRIADYDYDWDLNDGKR